MKISINCDCLYLSHILINNGIWMKKINGGGVVLVVQTYSNTLKRQSKLRISLLKVD